MHFRIYAKDAVVSILLSINQIKGPAQKQLPSSFDMMLLSSLALVFLPIILAANPRTCLPSGDEKSINLELAKGECSSLSQCSGSAPQSFQAANFVLSSS